MWLILKTTVYPPCFTIRFHEIWQWNYSYPHCSSWNVSPNGDWRTQHQNRLSFIKVCNRQSDIEKCNLPFQTLLLGQGYSYLTMQTTSQNLKTWWRLVLNWPLVCKELKNSHIRVENCQKNCFGTHLLRTLNVKRKQFVVREAKRDPRQYRNWQDDLGQCQLLSECSQ